MTKIITDDAILRQYIPNVMATVDDEKPLYDKMLPFIETAETWLMETLIGEQVFDIIANGEHDTRFANVALAVVSRAFSLAVPSLDLVLTPNGFGIVSTNNVAPASKERVERLIESLKNIETQCLTVLLQMLKETTEWHESKQCKWLASSIIQDLRLLPSDKRSWDEFILLRQKAYDIEQEIAKGWISPQLMSKLAHYEATATYDENITPMITHIVRIVVGVVDKGKLNKRGLDDTVSYIRAFPAKFPEWHGSPTAELFTPPIFENKKASGGYFF